MLTKMVISEPKLSETERVKQQTIKEWRAELEGAGGINESVSPQIVDVQPKTETKKHVLFLKSLKETGIISVRFVGDYLLITTDRPITTELDNRIKRDIPRLTEIAEHDTEKSLYEYIGYRTFFGDRKPCLAVEFKEVRTGEIAVRYFNIKLKNNRGKSFNTGINGQFLIEGNIKRPMKGSFIKFWLNAVMDVPDERPSHIYRYMNPKLSGVVVSCDKIVPHHNGLKLTNIKYEGRLYQTT